MQETDSKITVLNKWRAMLSEAETIKLVDKHQQQSPWGVFEKMS